MCIRQSNKRPPASEFSNLLNNNSLRHSYIFVMFSDLEESLAEIELNQQKIAKIL